MSHILKTCVIKLIRNSTKQQIRHYPRWSHRIPARVILPEEQLPNHAAPEDNYKKFNSAEPRIKDGNNIIDIDEVDALSENVENPKKKQFKKKITTDMLETVIDSNGNIIYTKMKDNDPRIGSLLVTVKSKKEKQKKDLVLLEGKRLIKEALTQNCKLKYLIFSRQNEIEYLKSDLPKSGCKIYKMPYKEIQMWSDLTTSPGIMGLFQIPDVTSHTSKNTIPLIIICDNIREPGNLGTILRTCAGVGCAKVILTKGCANLWDTKVMRSSTGAHFNLQIHNKLDWPEITKLIDNDSKILIADNKIVSSDINIPESSNYIFQLLQSLPVIPYFGMRFSSTKPIILIVGGETEGISVESYKFAAENNGVRLNIPLENNIDSLNTGMALGIIMFEIKKQLYQESAQSVENVTFINT